MVGLDPRPAGSEGVSRAVIKGQSSQGERRSEKLQEAGS